MQSSVLDPWSFVALRPFAGRVHVDGCAGTLALWATLDDFKPSLIGLDANPCKLKHALFRKQRLHAPGLRSTKPGCSRRKTYQSVLGLQTSAAHYHKRSCSEMRRSLVSVLRRTALA